MPGFQPADEAASLGEQLHALKRYPESRDVLREAQRHHPRDYRINFALGQALCALGENRTAATHYRMAIAARPDHAVAYNSLGHILRREGDLPGAIRAFGEAIGARPDLPIACYNLGNALHAAGRHAEALTAARRFLKRSPNHLDGLLLLAHTLIALRRHVEAVSALRPAVAAHPDNNTLRFLLATTSYQNGDVDAAIIAYREILARNPRDHAAYGGLLIMRNYRAADPVALLAEHVAASALLPTTPTGARKLGRRHRNRLRVGYVSPDFRGHPVGSIMDPILRHHDRDRFEIFAYSSSGTRDALTDRIRAHTDQWRDILRLSDERAADLVKADELDLLVDLSGYTFGHRLGVFARKPAPVQATWLGYPNTTGLAAIDYRVTCAVSDPVGRTEHHHSEKLARLSPCFLSFEARDASVPVASSPIFTKKHITFGCFNNLAKITPETLAAWARVLEAIPNARLFLRAKQLADTTLAEDWRQKLALAGIDPTRVRLEGRVGAKEYLTQFGEIDVALDPFPYNGTATTLDGLWMGVPHLTLAGDRHAARVGASLCHAVGHDEMVVSSQDEYVRRACELAGSPERLASLRSGLRERLQHSPLGRPELFTPLLERLFADMIANKIP